MARVVRMSEGITSTVTMIQTATEGSRAVVVRPIIPSSGETMGSPLIGDTDRLPHTKETR